METTDAAIVQTLRASKFSRYAYETGVPETRRVTFVADVHRQGLLTPQDWGAACRMYEHLQPDTLGAFFNLLADGVLLTPLRTRGVYGWFGSSVMWADALVERWPAEVERERHRLQSPWAELIELALAARGRLDSPSASARKVAAVSWLGTAPSERDGAPWLYEAARAHPEWRGALREALGDPRSSVFTRESLPSDLTSEELAEAGIRLLHTNAGVSDAVDLILEAGEDAVAVLERWLHTPPPPLDSVRSTQDANAAVGLAALCDLLGAEVPESEGFERGLAEAARTTSITEKSLVEMALRAVSAERRGAVLRRALRSPYDNALLLVDLFTEDVFVHLWEAPLAQLDSPNPGARLATALLGDPCFFARAASHLATGTPPRTTMLLDLLAKRGDPRGHEIIATCAQTHPNLATATYAHQRAVELGLSIELEDDRQQRVLRDILVGGGTFENASGRMGPFRVESVGWLELTSGRLCATDPGTLADAPPLEGLVNIGRCEVVALVHRNPAAFTIWLEPRGPIDRVLPALRNGHEAAVGVDSGAIGFLDADLVDAALRRSEESDPPDSGIVPLDGGSIAVLVVEGDGVFPVYWGMRGTSRACAIVDLSGLLSI